MSIGDSMQSAWEEHPYLIMGLGGVVVLYFLWPSSSGSSSSSAGSDTYGQQLAASTVLSQSQVAAQVAQSANATAAYQTMASTIGASDTALAQANAAAIVSYNQTAQTALNDQAGLAGTITSANATDFNALINGLTTFGQQVSAGSTTASANGLSAYLTSIGANFSVNTGPNGITGGSGSNISNNSNNAAAVAGGGAFGVSFSNSSENGGVHLGGSPWAESYGQTVSAATSPFNSSDALLAQLWSKTIDQYSRGLDIQQYATSALGGVATTQPILAGQIQTIPAPTKQG